MSLSRVSAFLIAIIALTISTISQASPEQDHFCQGVGLMSGNLQQRLQQGQDIKTAINGVLDETEAPTDQRDSIGDFLSNLAVLIKTLPFNASATQAFVQLSCGPGHLFGDENARSTYQKNFPRYLAGGTACNQKATSLEDLHNCMTKVFAKPAATLKQ